MHKPVVVGRPVSSQVLLIGQAPGGKEPLLGRPFAWTAGKTLFRWLQSALVGTKKPCAAESTLRRSAAAFPEKIFVVGIGFQAISKFSDVLTGSTRI